MIKKKVILKPIIISQDEMDKLEKIELKAERKIASNGWYDWFSNYVPNPIKNQQINL